MSGEPVPLPTVRETGKPEAKEGRTQGRGLGQDEEKP